MGYIVLNSKFKPFSYQEMLAPIMQAQEAHDKADAEINTLLENAALNASSFGPNDTAEKAIYDDLIGRLKDASDQLSNRGINPSLKREISNINKEYRTSLLPIQKKLTKRAELAAEQRKLQSSNPYIRFSKDYNTASLNDIHDASTYGIIDLEKIAEQTALDFQKETSGITRTDFEPIPIGNTGHYNVITGYGYTPKEMEEAWGDTNNPIYQKYLEKTQHIDSLDYNEELKDEMKLAIWEGMKAGAGKFNINRVAGKTTKSGNTGSSDPKSDYKNIIVRSMYDKDPKTGKPTKATIQQGNSWFEVDIIGWDDEGKPIFGEYNKVPTKPSQQTNSKKTVTTTTNSKGEVTVKETIVNPGTTPSSQADSVVQPTVPTPVPKQEKHNGLGGR